LEFDHLGDKNFGIAAALPNRKWQAVLDEIATCDAFVQTVIVGEPLSARNSPARW
jgi:hypothetical protein